MKFIDLGLPSGTLWANCNIGAVSPESYGNYYTWDDLDLDEVPTLDEMKELINECTWEWTSVNGVEGRLVTGPNGNSIFLPAAGYRSGTSLLNAGGIGYYWSATPYSDSYYAYYLYFYSGGYRWSFSLRYYGQAVRPVKRINNLKNNDNMKPITPSKARKEVSIPDKAIEIINDVIVQHFTGTESIFTEDYLVSELLDNYYTNTTIDGIIRNIPGIYSEAGWQVTRTANGFIFTELLN